MTRSMSWIIAISRARTADVAEWRAMSGSVSNTRLARLSASGSSSTTRRRYEGSGTVQMLPPSLIAAQGTDIFPSMVWGKRRHALSSAVAAARVAVAPRPDPRVAAELSRTLAARTVASCWVAVVIIPFTIVAYDGAYFPEKLPQCIVAAAFSDALILTLLFLQQRRVFDRLPWLPFAILAEALCNAAEASNLMLTGGAESDFVFPYYLISFGIPILFPPPLPSGVATVWL